MSQICVLKRITTKDHQNCDKFNQIQLKKDFNQIYIGRDVDCNYRISSIEISRKHALLEFSPTDHFWTISDLNSTNGLFVNSVQLQPYNPYRLVNGDKVSFGPPNQSQFCYQFVDNSVYELPSIGLTAIPVIPIVTRIQTSTASDSVITTGLHIGIEANHSRTVSLTSTMPTRSGLNYTVSTTRAPRLSGNSAVKKVMSRKASETVDRHTIAEHDYSRNSSAIDKNRKSASKKLRFKDTEHRSSKVSDSERKLIEKEREKLEKSKKSLEQQKHMDRQKIRRKEEALRKKQKALERKERDAKKREEEIEKMRKDLEKEKSLMEKNKLEMKEVEKEKTSKRKLRSSSVRDSGAHDTKRQCKEDQKKVIEDLLESDLTCSICSDYFIQAVNLNCSHTFCEHCIEEWKRTNSDEAVCPICRKTIENQNRELVLDNLIDLFIAQTKPTLVEHRKKVAEDRKKKMAKKVLHNQNTGPSARERLTRLIPSLHFFLRSSNTASSSESDTDDLSIINVNLDDFDSNSSISSWSSDSSDSDSDDTIDDSSSGDESVASSQNSIASVTSVQSDHNYIDIDISSLYSSPASNNGSNDSNDYSDSDSDVESVVSIHSDDDNQVEIDINANDSDDSEDSDYSD